MVTMVSVIVIVPITVISLGFSAAFYKGQSAIGIDIISLP